MCWILETSATYQMICSADLLTTNLCATNRKEHLPIGAIDVVTHLGIIHFSDFVLHDVPCVPSFKLNPITISKHVCNSQCLAIFTNDDCMLQDQRSGKMIGMGTEWGGLNYLITPQKTR